MRSTFPILEDGNEEGKALTMVKEGDEVAIALPQSAVAFAFKDKDGNAILPQLNNEGAIVVTGDAGTTKRAFGDVLEGAQALDTPVQVCSIAVTALKEYTALSFLGSCFRETEIYAVLVEDVGGVETETLLGRVRTSAGNPNAEHPLMKDTITIGSSVANEIRLMVKPKENKVDDCSGSISINEMA